MFAKGSKTGYAVYLMYAVKLYDSLITSRTVCDAPLCVLSATQQLQGFLHASDKSKQGATVHLRMHSQPRH